MSTVARHGNSGDKKTIAKARYEGVNQSTQSNAKTRQCDWLVDRQIGGQMVGASANRREERRERENGKDEISMHTLSPIRTKIVSIAVNLS